MQEVDLAIFSVWTYTLSISSANLKSVRKKEKALSFNESKMSKIVRSRVSSNFQESSSLDILRKYPWFYVADSGKWLVKKDATVLKILPYIKCPYKILSILSFISNLNRFINKIHNYRSAYINYREESVCLCAEVGILMDK